MTFSELIGDHLEFEVESILKCRNTKKRGKEYLEKWRGYLEKRQLGWKPSIC